MDDKARLAHVVVQVADGNPVMALEHLSVYMVKFGYQEKENGDASSSDDETSEDQ